jgi:hypothetical protein
MRIPLLVVLAASTGCATLLAIDSVEYGGEKGPDGGQDGRDARIFDGTGSLDAADPLDAGDAPTSTSLQRAIMRDTPVAYFPLDEPAQSIEVIDQVHSVRALVVGPVTLGVPGVARTSASFPGTGTSDESIRSAGGAGYDFTGGKPFSVEAWVRPKRFDGTYSNVVLKKVNGNGYELYFARSGNVVTATFQVGSSDSQTATATAPLPTVDLDGGQITRTWVHLVGTFDATTLTLFIDGKPASAASAATPAGFPTDSTSGLLIGDLYAGEIDEVAFYDKALSPSQIEAHYAAR